VNETEKEMVRAHKMTAEEQNIASGGVGIRLDVK